ncbi:kinesin-like protein KIN-7I isoform X2 [Lolium perenne]|uniref:kinesin-like protein KIN-7I isoform X2 n=1 Tax=Lolium perenne TaxID=4522 RepID=UPI0021F5EFA1|nr:kinesin-like protein KIN-7I isoform X2 [Lolium perenne]
MDRIHVTVRARPLSAEDAQSSPWRISGNAVALTTQPSTRFDFDEIFSEECRTADVYGARTKHIVDSAVQGFNGTVFAYGQTNSGKTYTMRGSTNEPGIIPLAVHDLFRSIQEHMDREFLVRMSYMEIYNEEINDLLVPEHRKLQIHENYERGIHVAGLREEIVTYPEQVLDFVSFGESHRHIGETNMNVYSSRSHTIFRMVIESREKADETEAGDSCDAVRVSVLNLVDLAGSERAAKTGAEGVRLKEGSHINKSLMTLGTVIKKLSEGVKGQGGHVPYRDSKLTRILQPALGGNANTAIICNITLAQIHADETKSSLQFASRALRVTNCAEVNEILTDAALLKRQRKEIEELRAKLKNSQSEHWDEDVLNLRNTLLQSELEKERIALELEEERKAKEHREKRLLQQAKKIENLSSLVLNSDRDDRVVVSSKNKRRQTWCARPLSRQLDVEVPELVEQGSARSCGERDMGMPPSFEELMQESPASNSEPAHGCSSSDLWNEDISLPDSHALLNVTSRRKPNTKKLVQEQLRSLVPESPQDPNEWKDAMLCQEITNPNGLSARESEAILVIKQLQDQVNLLESEKSLIQNNLDDVLELATQQKASFSEKYEELQRNALVAQEQAKTADEKLSALATIEKSKQELAYSFLSKVSMETQGIVVQMDQMTHSVDGAISFIEELFQNHSVIAENVTKLKELAYGHITQSSYVIRDHEKMSKKLMEKIRRLELEKKLLNEQFLDQQDELQRTKSSLESCEKSMDDCILQNDMEKDSILSELLTLRKEVSTLSSSSLMKEKESIRKELDRAKIKLRETENKLKNYIQEKIKLEGEKAEAHKEIKKLQNQRTLLERDLRKHDSLTVDKRHELNVKPEELAGFFDQAAQMQEEYQRLEIHASDMEAEIASLQETLITSSVEKEEALSKVELMMLEHEDLENRFTSTESKMNSLSDEIAVLNKKLDASESSRRKLEASLSSLSGEKEDLGMQLTDVLLEMESERSMWISKEKSYLEAKQQLDICNDENSKLSEDLIKARQELVQCRELLKTLEGKMILSVEDDLNEKKCGRESCKESELVDKGRNIDNAADENELHKQLLLISEERDSLLSKMEQMSLAISELEVLKEDSNNKLIQAKANMDELSCQISTMEVKMKHDASTFNKEKTKLRMQIRWLQPELDANRGRLKEAVEERRLMDYKYQEATAKLKKELKETCQKVLKLREELKKSQGASNGSSNVSSTQLM